MQTQPNPLDLDDDSSGTTLVRSESSDPSGESLRMRRARAAWPARFLSKAGVVVNVTVCDVSESDLGLLGDVPMTKDTHLDITLSVPDARDERRTHAVRAGLRVVSSSPVGSQYRIEAKLVDVPLEARVGIRKYVLGHS